MKLYTIKTLEWEEQTLDDGSTILESNTPLYNYYIINSIYNSASEIGCSIKGKYSTIDEAKTACQGDYEKRLSGCLELKINDDQLKIVIKALFVYGQICDDEDGDFKEKALQLLKENNFEL